MGRWSRKRMLNDNGWFFLVLEEKRESPKSGPLCTEQYYL